jgi:hypothetical protein
MLPREAIVMNKICLVLLPGLLAGCSSLPEQYSKSPTRSLVQGVLTYDSSVLIRSVDGGPVIWVKGHRLGDKVWLEPGLHKISVMCSTSTTWGAYTTGAEVEVEVERGYSYLITTGPIKNKEEKPQVQVTKKEKK